LKTPEISDFIEETEAISASAANGVGGAGRKTGSEKDFIITAAETFIPSPEI
jgi:hypothetical protein